MQRMQIRGDAVELTDDLDIISITGHPGDDVLINRQESSVKSATHPELIIVEGDNVTRLGEWLTERIVERPPDDSEPQIFFESNETDLRISAIALPPIDYEDNALKQAVENLDVPLDTVLDYHRGSSRRLTQLDARISNSGLKVPENYRSRLYTEHRAGQLNLFIDQSARIPMPTARKFGEWIIEGKQILKKSSIWGV